MTLQNLIKKNDWLSVELTLMNLYPDLDQIIETYKEMFQKLQAMTLTQSDIQIELEHCFEDETDIESYVHVSGQKPIPDNSNVTESLAIEFVPWSEWLGMSIHRRTLKEFNELEIITHCMVEMAFAGFEEKDIQERYSDMKKIVADYKNMTEDEKRSETKSLNDLLNKPSDT